VTGLSRLRHYTNLDACAARLARLLRDFRFAPVRDVWPEAVRPAARSAS
jgi:hypothetical protein